MVTLRGNAIALDQMSIKCHLLQYNSTARLQCRERKEGRCKVEVVAIDLDLIELNEATLHQLQLAPGRPSWASLTQ